MNIQEIRELAKIMRENGLSSLHLTEGVLDIQLERLNTVSTTLTDLSKIPEDSQKQENDAENKTQLQSTTQTGVVKEELAEVKSPMVGVFYSAPSPEAEPFVKVGSRVKKGDVLCIIEAMKLMNEITAEADGEIAEICIENGGIVEYEQTLFQIR